MMDILPSLIFTIAALVVCLVLAWLFIKSLHRFNTRSMHPHRGIHVVTSAPVGTRERITIVNYRDKQYMLGVTNAGIELIDTLNIDDDQPQKTDND